MSAMLNENHGPHCAGNGKLHCFCNECHNRPVVDTVIEQRPCGCHCLGHYCEKCAGSLNNEMTTTHCRCPECHNIPEVVLGMIDSSRNMDPVNPIATRAH